MMGLRFYSLLLALGLHNSSCTLILPFLWLLGWQSFVSIESPIFLAAMGLAFFSTFLIYCLSNVQYCIVHLLNLEQKSFDASALLWMILEEMINCHLLTTRGPLFDFSMWLSSVNQPLMSCKYSVLKLQTMKLENWTSPSSDWSLNQAWDMQVCLVCFSLHQNWLLFQFGAEGH